MSIKNYPSREINNQPCLLLLFFSFLLAPKDVIYTISNLTQNSSICWGYAIIVTKEEK